MRGKGGCFANTFLFILVPPLYLFVLLCSLHLHRMVCKAVDQTGLLCGADVPRAEILSHEEVCPNRLIRCRMEGCGEMVPYVDHAAHESMCAFRPMTCACGTVRMKSVIRLVLETPSNLTRMLYIFCFRKLRQESTTTTAYTIVCSTTPPHVVNYAGRLCCPPRSRRIWQTPRSMHPI